MSKRSLITLGLLSVALVLILSTLFSAHHTQRSGLQADANSSMIKISLCIDYGNGTKEWFNGTVPKGYSLLNATDLIAEVKYTYWPAYKASFVDAINGVSNKPPYFWMWYYWDTKEKCWKLGSVGADRYKLRPDEIVMWRYEKPSMHR